MSVSRVARRIVHKFSTKEGLLGDYDYAYLFTPRLPFMKGAEKVQPFFGLDDEIPVVLGFLLGLQHALSMLAGVASPPIIIGALANLNADQQQYLVSCSLIISGVLSAIQITRFKIPYTPYYIGTGLVSVVGTSFATISIVSKAFPIMYNAGVCPVDSDGTQLPCPDGYGAILGTAAVCGLLEVLLSPDLRTLWVALAAWTPPTAVPRATTGVLRSSSGSGSWCISPSSCARSGGPPS
ncbi:hypothetical protein KL905_003150 [Ogataea polymorpha]|nr:hypothetical protein KL936_003517 [Ogataea polymorpha]KAG7892515.1 hypothetical protein KL908_003467 [Ogataea polymorpha]KAG7902835.1 hypothetical protein KL907_003968 [Ogataea polymorpha]KAG7909290.1 hypothetical protein KL906_002784 [Ogataea polymorpha]KAG7920516.1 hypothetical protein KL905_003150 [Ogataea polymorpha]